MVQDSDISVRGIPTQHEDLMVFQFVHRPTGLSIERVVSRHAYRYGIENLYVQLVELVDKGNT
jgi:hypothetical protein